MATFFGPNPRTKESERWMDELPRWFIDRMQRQFQLEDEEIPIYQWLRDRYNQQLQDGYDQGFGTPEELIGYGQYILPGVDESYDNARRRTLDLQALSGELPGYEALTGELSSILDAYGSGITSGYDRETGGIRDTFNRIIPRADEYNRQIVKNLGESYDAAQRVTDDEFRKSYSDVDSTFSDLGRSGDAILDSSYGDLDILRPASAARQARVGRSFAPALASTMMRIRRSGVDPTSPEASAMLARVESDRARAMDDSAAEDAERYISRKHNLDLTRLNRGDRLGLSRLDTQLGLYGRQGDINRGLSLDRGQQFRNELIRQNNQAASFDLNRLDRDTEAGRLEGQRADQYWHSRMSLPEMRSRWADRDFQRGAYLADRESGDFQQYLDNRARQFGLGSGYQSANLGRRDQYVDRTGLAADRANRNSLSRSQLGRQYGDMAMEGYGGTYMRNQPRSGWGSRLLGGLGGAAFNYATGGIGNLLGKLKSGTRKKPGPNDPYQMT